MVDCNVIVRRSTVLEEYLRDLAEVKNKSFEEFLSDKVLRRYIERTLHVTIECCLDITNHIISYEGYREPLNNKDAFHVITEHGIIDANLGESLKKMAQFRNIIVHDYIRIQPEIVFAILQKNLGDIVKFAGVIKDRYIPT